MREIISTEEVKFKLRLTTVQIVGVGFIVAGAVIGITLAIIS